MKIIMMFVFGLSIANTYAMNLDNPYLNKNLDTHPKEFLAYEVQGDFQKAIEQYNLERKDRPEIKQVLNSYEIIDGKNKVNFNISLVLKGTFYYNGQLTNLKEVNKTPNNKSVFISLFIDTAEAANPISVSNVLIAALLNVDGGFKKFSFLRTASDTETVIAANWAKIKERIAKYQNSCEEIKENVSAKSALNKMENLLAVMNSKKGKEADTLNDALSFVGSNCSEQYARQKATVGGKARADAEADAMAPEAREVCASLQQLKTCIIAVPDYHMAVAPRIYLKEKINSRDDLQEYSSTSTVGK